MVTDPVTGKTFLGKWHLNSFQSLLPKLDPCQSLPPPPHFPSSLSLSLSLSPHICTMWQCTWWNWYSTETEEPCNFKITFMELLWLPITWKQRFGLFFFFFMLLLTRRLSWWVLCVFTGWPGAATAAAACSKAQPVGSHQDAGSAHAVRLLHRQHVPSLSYHPLQRLFWGGERRRQTSH